MFDARRYFLRMFGLAPVATQVPARAAAPNNLSDLRIGVDTTGVEEATKACDLLREAAERAASALDSLSNKSHGGIKIHIIGQIAEIEIMPPAPASISKVEFREVIEGLNEAVRDGYAVYGGNGGGGGGNGALKQDE